MSRNLDTLKHMGNEIKTEAELHNVRARKRGSCLGRVACYSFAYTPHPALAALAPGDARSFACLRHVAPLRCSAC